VTPPRRRLVRPTAPGSAADPNRQRQLQRLRVRRERERAALARWQKRLRRAFNTVEKLHRRLASLERSIARIRE